MARRDFPGAALQFCYTLLKVGIAILLGFAAPKGFTTDVTTPNKIGPNVGNIAPPFEARDLLSSDTILLSDYRGKYVVLDFWASWCEPCREHFDDWAKLQDQYPGDLQVLAVNVAEMDQLDKAREVAKEDKLPFPIPYELVDDSAGPDNPESVATLYDVGSLPTSILIDREGRIVARHNHWKGGILEQFECYVKESRSGAECDEVQENWKPNPS